MRLWGIALVFAACGGSPRHTSAPEDPERKRIEAMEPPSPYAVQRIRGYTAPAGCSQGPFRIAAVATGARFGEQLEVNICAPRSLQGDYRFTHGTEKGEPHHFGSRNNSDRCVPTAAEMASHGVATAGQGGAAPGGNHSTSSASLASATPAALTPVTGEVGEHCPEGTYLTGILDFSMLSNRDGIAWEPGTPLMLDVWSTEPLDLDGAMFVVIQRGVRADMTVDGWKAYNDARDRWVDAWNAYLAGEVKAGRESYYDDKARSADAPPPPRVEAQPPRPSVHAEWIAGFWQRDGAWIWSPGFWRVPEADIAAEQTAEAPVAPPAVKTETPPPPAASATLVWTPGYWAWTGSAYIWIDGAWRIPPKAEARWVAPTWTPRRGRVVLVPGGWSIRIGR
jgi:hypothetical protein